MTTRPPRGKSAPPSAQVRGLAGAVDTAHRLPSAPRPKAAPAPAALTPEAFAAYAAPTERHGWDARAASPGARQAARAAIGHPDTAAPLLEAEAAPEKAGQCEHLAAALMLADGPRALLAWARGESAEDAARDVFARCGRPRTLATFLGALEATTPLPPARPFDALDLAAIAPQTGATVRADVAPELRAVLEDLGRELAAAGLVDAPAPLAAVVRLALTRGVASVRASLAGAAPQPSEAESLSGRDLAAAALRGDVGAAVRGVLELAAGAELRNRQDAIRAIAATYPDDVAGPRGVRS